MNSWNSKQYQDEGTQTKRLEQLEQAEADATPQLPLMYETLMHCSEPADSNVVLEKLGVAEDVLAKQEKQEKEEAAKEHEDGLYRVKFDGTDFPVQHRTWPAEFVLNIDEKLERFQVLKSKDDPTEDPDQTSNTDYSKKDPTVRIGEFGYWYACGKRSKDAKGNIKGKPNDQIEFNFAEHQYLGEMLSLTWKDGSKTDGSRKLTVREGNLRKLTREVKLSYGEINGLGGDFFGGYNPVSNGKDLEERVKFFQEAWDTLALVLRGQSINCWLTASLS